MIQTHAANLKIPNANPSLNQFSASFSQPPVILPRFTSPPSAPSSTISMTFKAPMIQKAISSGTPSTSKNTTVAKNSTSSTPTGSTTVVVLSTKDQTTGQPVTVTNSNTGTTTPVTTGQLHTESSTGHSTTQTVSLTTLESTSNLLNKFKNPLSSSANNEIQGGVTAQGNLINNGTLVVSKGNGKTGITTPSVGTGVVNSQPTVLQDQISFAAAAAKTAAATTPFAGTYVGPTALLNVVNLTIFPNSAFTFSATGGIPGGQGSFTGNINSNGSISVGIPGAANSISTPPPSGSPSTYNGFYNGSTPGPPIPFTAAKQ